MLDGGVEYLAGEGGGESVPGGGNWICREVCWSTQGWEVGGEEWGEGSCKGLNGELLGESMEEP